MATKKSAGTKKSAAPKKAAAKKESVISSAGAFGEAISDALTGDEAAPAATAPAAPLTGWEARQAAMYEAEKEAAKTVKATS